MLKHRDTYLKFHSMSENTNFYFSIEEVLKCPPIDSEGEPMILANDLIYTDTLDE